MARTGMSPALRKGSANKPKRSLDETRAIWLEAFRRVRAETEKRASHLSAEDQIVQSMADASPTKWHRAHVTWFFEQFLLVPHDPAYRIFDERFPFLFNSYYVAAGPRHARPQRGLITRPNGADVAAYRAHVDAAVERLIEKVPAEAAARVFAIVEIGLHHEQQHQELLLTDILHAFAQNPDRSGLRRQMAAAARDAGPARLRRCAGRHACDRPRRRGLLLRQRDAAARRADSARADRPASRQQRRVARIHRRWRLHDAIALAVGRLDTVQNEGWQAPGYWRQKDGAWHVMTLGGVRPVDPAAPVMHVSYYEADAFARFAGKHLPSEAEWETAARA